MTREELGRPSGMLDLREESGLKVMRECGLWDKFQAATGECSETWKVLNPQGIELHVSEGGLDSRPEISRNSLTNLFVNSVPSECINWNHKITAVRDARNPATGATEITLDLGANGQATYDFVVGADGAWSQVRNLLTEVKPFYDGAQFVTVTIRNASTKYPRLTELCGSGSLMALGGKNGIITQRGPQDSIRVYAIVSTVEEHWVEAAGLKDKPAVEFKSALLDNDKLFRNWAPLLKELVATACDEDTKDRPDAPAEVWPLRRLPVYTRWEPRTGATLVGDAAHLQPPWSGEGVNLALWDSLDLADAISGVPEVEDAASWQAALEPRIREYESKMFARADENGEETVQSRDTMLSEHGGQAMANMMKGLTGDMPPAGGQPELP